MEGLIPTGDSVIDGFLDDFMNKTIKAIGLLSGGLDSTLAVKMMIDQGIDVTVLNFTTPFCTCTRKGCRHEASRVAKLF